MRENSVSTTVQIALLLLAGCPSPNLYGTARTVPRGESQHTFAAEDLTVRATGSTASTPTPPTYQYRRGLSDEVDLGLRLPSFSALGLDVKWNLVRGPIDLAIDPGFAVTYLSGADVAAALLFLNLPLVIGVPVGDSFTLIATPGVGAGLASVTVEEAEGDTLENAGAGSAYARLGVGAEIRVGARFAFHPEITALRPFDGGGTIVSAGLGITFGAMPRSDREQRQLVIARARASELARSAVAIASDGDCAAALRLGAQVRDLDPDIDEAEVTRDRTIARCLAEAEAIRLAEARSARARCVARRSEMALRAAATKNRRRQVKLYLTLPDCGPALPPPTLSREAPLRARPPLRPRPVDSPSSRPAPSPSPGSLPQLDDPFAPTSPAVPQESSVPAPPPPPPPPPRRPSSEQPPD